LSGNLSVLNRFKHTLSVLALAGCATLALSRPAAAETVETVLELFTSQGCSSCPPADKLVASMAADKQRLVLSLPVDYWDYLGWKDTLAHSAFSARQKAYAQSRGDRQVYTPQIVINGMHHAVGSDREAVEAGSVASGSLPYRADVSKKGDDFIVTLPATSDKVSGTVLIMPVLHQQTVKIGRGENRGEDVTYVNIVRGISEIGSWDGTANTITVPKSALGGEAGDADSFVVLVQHQNGKNPGMILAAAKAPGF
jgi:hypothetical protein